MCARPSSRPAASICVSSVGLIATSFTINSEHFGVPSLDFENSSQRTLICQLETPLRLFIFVKKVGIDALCQQLRTLSAQADRSARNKLLHEMTTTWWDRLQTSTAASWISSVSRYKCRSSDRSSNPVPGPATCTLHRATECCVKLWQVMAFGRLG